MAETGNYASLRVEGNDSLVIVPVSFNKPEIPSTVQQKWQKIVDLVAGIINVPSGLLTRFTEENLEILAASATSGNPYKNHDHDTLGIGMFCETVAGKRRALLVDDSLASSYWAANPHSGFGMRTYMGVPIQWEDGELFGTFCMLGNKANSIESSFLDLMWQFKDIIETDLRYILLQAELEKRLGRKERDLREIHHRLKNQFNLLIGYIDLQVFATGECGVKAALKEVQNRIQAVSLIHEQLHKSADGVAPSLDVYLKRLGTYIQENLMEKKIHIEFLIEALTLPMEQALAIAMILSELLTNSAKYAFPDTARGKITVQAKRGDDGTIRFTYRDNGIGLPDYFEPAAAKTLGMTLIDALSSQLNGTMKAESDDGAKFSFVFRI